MQLVVLAQSALTLVGELLPVRDRLLELLHGQGPRCFDEQLLGIGERLWMDHACLGE